MLLRIWIWQYRDIAESRLPALYSIIIFSIGNQEGRGCKNTNAVCCRLCADDQNVLFPSLFPCLYPAYFSLSARKKEEGRLRKGVRISQSSKTHLFSSFVSAQCSPGWYVCGGYFLPFPPPRCLCCDEWVLAMLIEPKLYSRVLSHTRLFLFGVSPRCCRSLGFFHEIPKKEKT